jgi:flagellar protein FliJ
VNPFRFRLQKVLMVREFETLVATQALVAARGAAAEASAAVHHRRQARVEYAGQLAQRRTLGMPAWEWAATARHYELLCQAEQEAAESLHRALGLVAERQVAVEGAMRREETLHKLQDHHLEAFQYAEQAAEQAALDEMAQTYRLIAKGVN